MYTYYILRRTQEGETLEDEGELDAEVFPGVDLDNGPAIINHLVQKLNQETGKTDNWEGDYSGSSHMGFAFPHLFGLTQPK